MVIVQVLGIVIARFIPRLQDTLEFKLYLVFAGLAVVMVTYVIFIVPETKNKSLEEISVALCMGAARRNADVKSKRDLGEREPLMQ